MSSSDYTNTQGSMGAFSKAKELQQKILFVVLALVVYRLGTFIPIPGINSEIFKEIGYAFRVTFLNKCDNLEKSIIAEYYQRCFGEDLPESSINIKI